MTTGISRALFHWLGSYPWSQQKPRIELLLAQIDDLSSANDYCYSGNGISSNVEKALQMLVLSCYSEPMQS